MVAKLTEWAFRTPLNRQNLRCRVVGENNSFENGAILYDCVEFEDYLGNVGLNVTAQVADSHEVVDCGERGRFCRFWALAP